MGFGVAFDDGDLFGIGMFGGIGIQHLLKKRAGQLAAIKSERLVFRMSSSSGRTCLHPASSFISDLWMVK